MSKRALGVDLGSKRIGLATCDNAGILASPLMVLERSGNKATDYKKIAGIAREEEAACVVVGLPVDLKGKQAIAAQAVLAEVAQLATVLDVPVHTHDERMTTAAAARNISGKDRKKKIDAAAAALILQSWLESR